MRAQAYMGVLRCRNEVLTAAFLLPSLPPQNIIQAYKNGAHLFSNTTSMGRWELVGSFFFSVSTITTIGKSVVGQGRAAGQSVASWLGYLRPPSLRVACPAARHTCQQKLRPPCRPLNSSSAFDPGLLGKTCTMFKVEKPVMGPAGSCSFSGSLGQSRNAASG